MGTDWYNTLNGRLRSIYKASERRAAKKNIKIEIDFDWVLSKYNRQKGKCLLTGVVLNANSCEHINPYSPSLDRRDSSQGYTKRNTRLICAAMNLALNSFGEEVFAELAKSFLKRKEGRDRILASKRTKTSREKASNSTSGSKNPRANLTEDQVLEIRRIAKEGKLLQKEIAEKFNIPITTTNHIITRYTWKHI